MTNTTTEQARKLLHLESRAKTLFIVSQIFAFLSGVLVVGGALHMLTVNENQGMAAAGVGFLCLAIQQLVTYFHKQTLKAKAELSQASHSN